MNMYVYVNELNLYMEIIKNYVALHTNFLYSFYVLNVHRVRKYRGDNLTLKTGFYIVRKLVFGQTVSSLSSYSMVCLLYTSPSPRDVEESRMPSSA